MQRYGGCGTAMFVPFIGTVEFGLLYYPLMMFAVIGIVNAVNLTDGLDGLASSVTFVVAVGFIIIAILSKLNVKGAVLIGIIATTVIYYLATWQVPSFEMADIFPERINTEFVRVVNRHTIKMRAYERGNKETFACGTGAAAAVVAAVENGFCKKGEDITIQLTGGDLVINYTDDTVYMTGEAERIFDGTVVL